jgi:NAD-dependent deacetylase
MVASADMDHIRRPADDDVIMILSGAGLSAASGVPTFRGAGGLWEGHRAMELATPEAWHADAELVRRFYDMRRAGVEQVAPNPGHDALVRLQQAWGAERVVLVTQNVDGLLGDAGALEVVEMHGSLRRLKCEQSDDHPRLPVAGEQTRTDGCSICGGRLRPDVVWFGEMPYQLDEIQGVLERCTWFLSVGTSGVVYPAAGFVSAARSRGARCVEVNPDPAGGPFHQVVAEGAETALPCLVDRWITTGG